MVSSIFDLNALNNASRRMGALDTESSSTVSRKDFLASLAGRIRSFGVGRRDPLIARARTVEALRELASHYEATQPSYAADLLAAADDNSNEDAPI
jgi:hypothetical protein